MKNFTDPSVRLLQQQPQQQQLPEPLHDNSEHEHSTNVRHACPQSPHSPLEQIHDDESDGNDDGTTRKRCRGSSNEDGMHGCYWYSDHPDVSLVGSSVTSTATTSTTMTTKRRRLPQQQQQQQPSSKQPKVVSFAEEAIVYGGDVTLEEVMDSWYPVEEYQAFKQERVTAIKLIKKNAFNTRYVERILGHCLRGFESYFSLEMNREIKYAREDAIRKVLAEQDRQRAMGIADHEAIRLQYLLVTSWIRSNALQLGQIDAEIVQQLEEDNNKVVTTTSNNNKCSTPPLLSPLSGNCQLGQHHHLFSQEDLLLMEVDQPYCTKSRVDPGQEELLQISSSFPMREQRFRRLRWGDDDDDDDESDGDDDVGDIEERFAEGIIRSLENSLHLVGQIDLRDNAAFHNL